MEFLSFLVYQIFDKKASLFAASKNKKLYAVFKHTVFYRIFVQSHFVPASFCGIA